MQHYLFVNEHIFLLLLFFLVRLINYTSGGLTPGFQVSSLNLSEEENLSNGQFELEQDTSQEWQFILATTDELEKTFAIKVHQATRFVRKIAIASSDKDASRDLRQSSLNLGKGKGNERTPLSIAFAAQEYNQSMAVYSKSLKAAALQIIMSEKEISVIISNPISLSTQAFSTSSRFESRFQFEFKQDAQGESSDSNVDRLSFA